MGLLLGGICRGISTTRPGKVTVRPYWYLKCSLASSPLVLSVCHGMLPLTMLTFDSEVADVGLRPGRSSIEFAVLLAGWYWITEIKSRKAKSSGHDCEENLPNGQSTRRLKEAAQHTYSSGSLFAPLFRILPSAFLAAALPA